MRQLSDFVPTADFLPDKEKPGDDKNLFQRFTVSASQMTAVQRSPD
jgi:hypothetical protein